MKRCKVNIPFRNMEKDIIYPAGTEMELPEDLVERVLKINVNMVTVLGEGKKSRSKAKAKQQ